MLRLDPDGSVPTDNPLGPDNPVYALGIRNSFGLCFDPATGDLWETENGPASDDEVNRIVAGGNHGWPDQLGPGGEPRFVDPALVLPEEIVPTGCAVSADGRRLSFESHRGGLYEADLSSNGTSAGPPGRIPGIDGSVIDVARGPDGTIYLATTDSILRWAWTATGSPVRGGSPTSPGFGGEARSGVGLVITAILIGGRIPLRSRTGLARKQKTSSEDLPARAGRACRQAADRSPDGVMHSPAIRRWAVESGVA